MHICTSELPTNGAMETSDAGGATCAAFSRMDELFDPVCNVLAVRISICNARPLFSRPIDLPSPIPLYQPHLVTISPPSVNLSGKSEPDVFL